AADMVDVLRRFSKFPLPANLAPDLTELVSRYGRVKLERLATSNGDGPTPLRLVCKDGPLLEELARQPKGPDHLAHRPPNSDLPRRRDNYTSAVARASRGVPRRALTAAGSPAEDLAGYTEGAPLPTRLRTLARSGLPFQVRDYQRDAADVFYAGGDARGGSGV